MLKLVSFHIQAHLNAFLQILEYFSQICLGPLARESPCIYHTDEAMHVTSASSLQIQLQSVYLQARQYVYDATQSLRRI